MSPPVVSLSHCMVSHIQQPHRSCFICSRYTAKAASSSSHTRCGRRRSVQYMATPRNDISRKRQVNRARWGRGGVVSYATNIKTKTSFSQFWFVNEYFNCHMHGPLSFSLSFLLSQQSQDLNRQVFKLRISCGSGALLHKLCLLCFKRNSKKGDSERLNSILHCRQQS